MTWGPVVTLNFRMKRPKDPLDSDLISKTGQLTKLKTVRANSQICFWEKRSRLKIENGHRNKRERKSKERDRNGERRYGQLLNGIKRGRRRDRAIVSGMQRQRKRERERG